MLVYILPRFFLLVWFLAISVTLFGAILVLMHLRRTEAKTDASDERGLEPISILKPLKGVDEGLEENLESFFRLNYPRFEILFSVSDTSDPVVPVVWRVMARHPEVSSRLMVCSVNSGPNPKINNLLTTYQSAKHEWILISDSNTRMEPDHLKALALQFKNGAAMQTSVVAGTNAHGLGGQLESAFLNTFYAKSLLVLNAFGHPCVIGKAMLFRKSVLERTGGLRSLEIHIAEDYAAGRRLHQLGFLVQISSHPIQQHLGRYSFKSFWSRHIRWGRLRKMQTPLGFAFEPLFNSILSGMFGASAFQYFYGVAPSTFIAIHLGLWFLSDLAVYTRVAGSPGSTFPLVWMLRELLHFPLWIHIASGRTINWRGRKIKLVKPKSTLPHAHMLQGLHEFLRKPYAQETSMTSTDSFHAPIEQMAEAYTSIDDELENDSQMVPLKTDLPLEPTTLTKES